MNNDNHDHFIFHRMSNSNTNQYHKLDNLYINTPPSINIKSPTHSNQIREPISLEQCDFFEIKICQRCLEQPYGIEAEKGYRNPYLTTFVEKFIQQTRQSLKTFHLMEALQPCRSNLPRQINEILLHSNNRCDKRPRTELTFSTFTKTTPIIWHDTEYAEIRVFDNTPFALCSQVKTQHKAAGVYSMSSWRPTLLLLRNQNKFSVYLTTHQSKLGSFITTIRSPSTTDIRKRYYAIIRVFCKEDDRLNTSCKMNIVGTFDTELEVLESKDFHIFSSQQKAALSSNQFNFMLKLEIHKAE